MFVGKPGSRLVAVLAGVSAAVGQARAFEANDLLAFSVGPLMLKPHVAAEEAYNDNVFYRSPGLNPIGDFITTISPGISATVGREEIRRAVSFTPLGVATEELPSFISIDYTAASHFYEQLSALDRTEHSFTMRDRLKGQRLTLEGSDSIQFLSGIIGQGFNLGTAVVDRTMYADSYNLTYDLTEKSSAHAAISYAATDYAEGTPLYSINTVQGTVGFTAKLLPKTGFFGEIYYGQSAVRPATRNMVALPDGPHADVEGAFIGVLGHFTQKLDGSVKVGYEVTSFGNHAPGMSAPVVEARLEQRISEKAALSLVYTRHGYVSVQGASVGFVADQVNLTWAQVIGETGKLTGGIGLLYLASEFQSSGTFASRHDDLYRISAGLSYKFNLWLKGNVGYEFEKFNSNYLPSIIDYNANRATLSLSVAY